MSIEAAATPVGTDTGPPKRRSGPSRREGRDGWILISPTFLVILVIVILPALWNVVLAFQDLPLARLRKTGLFGHFTLENFSDVFTDPGFWSSLWTTLIYSVASTAGSILVGLIAALVLRKPFPGRSVVRAFMLLPYVAPVVAATFVVKTMLDPQSGIINYWGTTILGWDQPINFLGTRPWALLSVIAFEIWRYFPFAFLFLTARLLTVPGDIEEAALVDGATPWQSFRFVLLPQLMPVISVIAVLRMIMTFNKFDDVYLLTGGTAGTEVSAVRVIDTLNTNFDIGGAAAQALVLSAVMGIFLVIYLRVTKRPGVNQ